MIRPVRAATVLVALSALAACGDGLLTAVAPSPAASALAARQPVAATVTVPSFLQAASDAPPFTSASVSFYAVQGKDRAVELTYALPGGDTDRLVRLRVRKKAQLVAPDGHLLAKGDSILITISVADAERLIVNFQPAGLRFLGSEAATLTMWYTYTNPDRNHDGVLDAADTAIESMLGIFRQEGAGAPWDRVTSIVNVSVDEVEANIGGFTNYVIAY